MGVSGVSVAGAALQAATTMDKAINRPIKAGLGFSKFKRFIGYLLYVYCGKSDCPPGFHSSIRRSG
jgi:hypothetical protein